MHLGRTIECWRLQITQGQPGQMSQKEQLTVPPNMSLIVPTALNLKHDWVYF